MVMEAMPWEVDDLARAGAAYGRVTVCRLDAPPVSDTFARVQPGDCLVLEAPGPDDAQELWSCPGQPRTRRLDLAAARDVALTAGLTVHDCGQWRTRYLFIDAAAAIAFVEEAWWLPDPLPSLGTHRGPITATASRFYLVASRPAE